MVKPSYRNAVLLFSSIFFYAWGEPKYVAIMLITIAVNYLGALLIGHTEKKKWVLFATIACDLGFLFLFKYFNFFLENINLFLSHKIGLLHIVMPIGISFYTFQALSYLVDVYRGDTEAQRNPYKLALYISLFPQLVAGPIVKYHDVAEEIDNRKVDWNDVLMGVKRFIIGLSKKILIANTMGAIADNIFSQDFNYFGTSVAWLGAIAYTMQIFFDFSGYSDMAIGLGLLFGFHFKENFDSPYISKSITEFWRRWHISLSTWFKEYVYIPLGGNRVSSSRTYVNIGIVFLLTGVWHGASWTFILWGVWHGLFNIIEKATGLHKDSGINWKEATKHIYTLFVVIIGWVLFRSDTLAGSVAYLGKMFGINGHGVTDLYTLEYYITPLGWIMLVAGALLSTPAWTKMTLSYKNKVGYQVAENLLLLTLFIISASFLAASTYNPFIYFRF